MAKPSRYTQAEIDKLVADGFWKTTISHIWERNARQYPDKEAITDSRATLTWAEAGQWIDRIALSLVELGIGRDEVIAVQLPNCIELHLLRVASEKAGVLCVPVTANMREQEMQHILKYTGARAVIIPWKYRDFDHLNMIERMRSGLPQLQHVLLVSDKVPEGMLSIREIARQPLEPGRKQTDSLEKRRFRPTEVSIINLTTGTTGLPKFVEYPAGANVAWGQGQAPLLKMDSTDVVAAIAPAARGPSLPAYYDAPLVAARIFMLAWNGPDEALKTIERNRVTVACLVPTQLAMMMEQFRKGNYNLSSVRLWYNAGSLIPPSLVKEVEEKTGGVVISDYGAVDFGGIIMSGLDDSTEVRMSTVGKPRYGAEVKMVDDNGEEVRTGDVGEILGRGPTCASGYYKDPKATNEAWNKDGWFAMGDLGEIDENGNLVLVGRKKELIIRGGQNIYPSEIENLLSHHPKIQDVAVVGMPDPVMGEKACAYVVTRDKEPLTFEEMITFLKEKNIAPFKLPERLETVDKLPMVSEQKVDKKALKQDIASKLSRG